MEYQGYELEQVREGVWEVPRQGAMRVPGRIYATAELLAELAEDRCIDQVVNVAQLPGIVGHALAMPDMHWGYGFPIGGVAAFDLDEGVISPGGVGYDINCGVRLLASKLQRDEVAPRIRNVVSALYRQIPSGVGVGGSVRLSDRDLEGVLEGGARWAVRKGFGTKGDLEHIEERGAIGGAEPDRVSDRAKQRGRSQLGTLGSGNHFAEVGYVDEVFDDAAAARLGLAKGTATVILHTGSRGLGHQVCTDVLRTLQKASKRYGFALPDRQLAAAPIRSPEGEAYLGAMRAAVNFAFANRQVLSQRVRDAFREALQKGDEHIGLRTVYEVAHNIAKVEEHTVGGERRELCVHRKGATRAFGPGRPEVPADYRDLGQPVLIPGDMGRCSYVLLGTETAHEETFGSTCHGAGRRQSRKAAKRAAKGRELLEELERLGVHVRASSKGTIAEEMPDAYKDVTAVVRSVEAAGISRIVCRLRPIGCVKG